MVGRWYPPEFEEVWRAYQSPMNSSKKVAHEAYKKAKDDRPEHFLLIKCVEAYNEWLKANGRKGMEYPKAHLSTWINQARWEGFLERGTEMLKADQEAVAARTQTAGNLSKSWPTPILSKLGLALPVLEKWFLNTKFIPGTPPEIVCPTRFHADMLLSKYPQQIERALGAGTIVSFKADI